MIIVREYEPLLKEDKDKLFFSNEEETEQPKVEEKVEEPKIEIPQVEEEKPAIPESKEEEKREIVDAADEIRKQFTKEISLQNIALEQNKDVPIPTANPTEEKEVEPPKVEEKVEESKNDAAPVLAEEKKELQVSEEPKAEVTPILTEESNDLQIAEDPKTEIKEESKVEVKEEPKVEVSEPEPKKEETTPEEKPPVNTQETIIASTPVENTPRTAIEPTKEESKTAETKVESTEKKEDKPNKDNKTAAIIVTLVLGLLTVYLFGRTIYGFYLGFKYKDYIPGQETETSKNNNDVDTEQLKANKISNENTLDSTIMQKTYN